MAKNHVVKVLCYYNPEDPAQIKLDQESKLLSLFNAARRNQLEFLLEIIVSREHQYQNQDILTVIDRLYSLGIRPDWWKLEPLNSFQGWQKLDDTITSWDISCRGILLLGLDQPINMLSKSFKLAAKSKLVKGFAVGRSIFRQPADHWFSGKMTDKECIKIMSKHFQRLCDIWISSSQDIFDS